MLGFPPVGSPTAQQSLHTRAGVEGTAEWILVSFKETGISEGKTKYLPHSHFIVFSILNFHHMVGTTFN